MAKALKTGLVNVFWPGRMYKDAFSGLFVLGCQSAAAGYCFGENSAHMPTPGILGLDTRSKMADNGEKRICGMAEWMNMPHVGAQLQN